MKVTGILEQLKALRGLVDIDLTKEEKLIILKFYEKRGKLATLERFEKLSIHGLKTILKEAGKL